MLNQRFTKEELIHFINKSNYLRINGKPTIGEIVSTINNYECSNRTYRYITTYKLWYYINKYNLRDMIYINVNVKRFTKEDLEEIIKNIGGKPTIKEIVYYVNINANENENFVSANSVRKYINMYNLKDLITERKRRTKKEMEGTK